MLFIGIWVSMIPAISYTWKLLLSSGLFYLSLGLNVDPSIIFTWKSLLGVVSGLLVVLPSGLAYSGISVQSSKNDNIKIIN